MGFDIYLASASPRRRELLEQIGVRYRLIEQNVPEQVLPGEAPADFVVRLALEKARVGWAGLKPKEKKPVLGADTAVIVEDKILGKPASKAEGLAMLEMLSGRCHEVYSAVALVAEYEAVELSQSRVCFRATTAVEREAYWASGECADKAGAYAIQGRAAKFITKLEGSYSGVMGLPLCETATLLNQFGLNID